MDLVGCFHTTTGVFKLKSKSNKLLFKSKFTNTQTIQNFEATSDKLNVPNRT